MSALKSIVFSLFAMLSVVQLSAQDTQFTQFYAAPTYLNPAFAGTTPQSRLSANYRNQWPAIPRSWVSYNFAYDQYVPEINSGFGFIATHDRAGSGALRGNNIAFQYAYEIKLTRQAALRPAIQFGYGNRNLNFNDLTFGDQLIRNNAATSLEEPNFEPISFFDVGTGALLFHPKYWLGVAIHHLNQPNESIYPDRMGLLPVKYSVHGGYRINTGGGMYKRRGNDLVFAFNYKQQADFNQLDLGAYLELDPLVIGLWYRGIPVFKQNGYGYLNQDAVAVTVGIASDYFRFGYSYDLTISQFNVASSAGAHEISIGYEWASVKNARLAKKRIIPCAKF